LLLLFKNINSLGFPLSARLTAQAPFIEPPQKHKQEKNNNHSKRKC